MAEGKEKLYSLKLPRMAIDRTMNSTTWRAIVNGEKNRLWKQRNTLMTNNPVQALLDGVPPRSGTLTNDARVVPPTYLSKDFSPSNPHWADVMDKVETEFKLNAEQKKAFRIVANHAMCIAPEQLLMHLSGMGGTGKSRVIKALVRFFDRQGEPYCLILLAPTGTVAALIGGCTYHSFLGINTGKDTVGESLALVEDVKTRMLGVNYMLMDKDSMLSTVNNCRISAHCCEVYGVFDKPYRG
jgi:hypothetical protein